MKADRLVLDTNVFISALLLASSTAARVLDHAITCSQLVVTDATQRELIAAMLSPQFDRHVPKRRREALLMGLAPVLERVEVIQLVRLCRDPHDDAVLEAALNGTASAVITGDKNLLALHPFSGIAIVTPADYLASVARGAE